MGDREKVMHEIERCINTVPYPCEDCSHYGHDEEDLVGCMDELLSDALELLKEQEPRILSLEEALEGKNGLEIDPCVFVEIKGREDIFIGTVNDVSHYNYPNLVFDVGECFRIDRSYSAASKNYLNTDYMKTVRCWTHKPSKEQRKAVKWDD